MSELTPKQIKKQQNNLKQYTTRKHTYKLSYIFRTYPYIQTDHAVEIAEYLRTNGECVDDAFIAFLRQFIIPNQRPSTYNVKIRDEPQTRLPRKLKTILDNTPPITI